MVIEWTHKIEDVPEIMDYIYMIEHPQRMVCKEQKQLVKLIRETFQRETLWINQTQIAGYMRQQEMFPYKLFEWEKFVFTLHNCVYRQDGRPRWREQFALVGRGAGKNGYLAFEDFCLLSPHNARFEVINGDLIYVAPIKQYHIDLFANSEDQAKMTFTDIYNILEYADPAQQRKMRKRFHWNKEVIRCLQTGSELTYRSSGTKTQDSRRPGKIDFDEYHNYENESVIGTAETGLGKKPYPKKTIITTNGIVRDGPLDHMIHQSEQILTGAIPDGGTLPFICRLDKKEQVDEEKYWYMANPSLQYFPDLLEEMRGEYERFKMDQIGNSTFMTKRMNVPMADTADVVTDWENILACSREPRTMPTAWVAGIDFSRTTDFVSVNLFGLGENGEWVWQNHSWVCSQCKDLGRIKFPIQDAVERGLITWVDDVEIPAELPVMYLCEQMEEKTILGVAVDDYRFGILKRALESAGFSADKNSGNVHLVKGRDIMRIAPELIAHLNRKEIAFGDNALLRWYINNAKQILDQRGNITFGKIEAKSRKTDGFMAAVASVTLVDLLENEQGLDDFQFQVYTF